MLLPKHIAVLGGGLSGLSSAYHLSRRYPKALITLVEKENRLGGWVQSTRVKVPDTDNTVLLESGPRTIRPKYKSILELVHLLNLTSSLIRVPSSSPAAQNRYIYSPSNGGISRVPSSLLDFVSPSRIKATWALTRVLLPAIAKDLFTYEKTRVNIPPNPVVDPLSPGPSELELDLAFLKDMSVHDFLVRQFGERFANLFGSALVHGIYAASSKDISLHAAFPKMAAWRERGNGSIIRGFLRKTRLEEMDDMERILHYGLTFPKLDFVDGLEYPADFSEQGMKMSGVSVYSFKEGAQALTDGLQAALESKENVRIHTSTAVTSLGVDESDKIEVTLANGETLNPSHVVSTLTLSTMQRVLKHQDDPLSPLALPHLTPDANKYSSVTVVNYVFRSSDISVPAGFGYLSPSNAQASPDKHKVIGVIFDSQSLAIQDSDPSKFVKITAMVAPAPATSSTPPDVDPLSILEEIALDIREAPVYTRVLRHTNCIPVPMPGHFERMRELKDALDRGLPEKSTEDLAGSPRTEEETLVDADIARRLVIMGENVDPAMLQARSKGKEDVEEEWDDGELDLTRGPGWKGRLEIIGAGVGGVSVGDCVDQARKVGERWVKL